MSLRRNLPSGLKGPRRGVSGSDASLEDDPFLPAVPPFLASSRGDGPPDPFRPPFRCDDPFRLRACLSSWFASPSLSLNAARVMRALNRPRLLRTSLPTAMEAGATPEALGTYA